MTDAELMDADCVHGRTWWECQECVDDLDDIVEQLSEQPREER